MISPSKPFNAQGDCLFFETRFAPELRNKIYALIFAIETNEDGSIELTGSTKPPSKNLSLTCQRIYSETRSMYRAAYRSFANHTFTIDQRIRTLSPEISLALGNDILSRINSFRVTWSNEHFKIGPLHFTTHIERDAPGQQFRTRVTHRGDDGDDDDPERVRKITRAAWNVMRAYPDIASTAIEKFRGVSSHLTQKNALNQILGWEIRAAVWDPMWERSMGFVAEVEGVAGRRDAS